MRILRNGSATAGVTAVVVVPALTSRCGPGAAPEPSAAQAGKADEDQDMADDGFLAREDADAVAEGRRSQASGCHSRHRGRPAGSPAARTPRRPDGGRQADDQPLVHGSGTRRSAWVNRSWNSGWPVSST